MDFIINNIEWIVTLFISIIFSGLTGHIYSQIKIEKRNKKQTIKRQLDIIDWTIEEDNIEFTLSQEGKRLSFKRFFSFRYTIKNEGNIKFDEFDHIVKINSKFQFIRAEVIKKSYSRNVNFEYGKPTFKFPTEEFKVNINPLNRDDEITIECFITSNEDEIELDFKDIIFDTNQDINFIEIIGEDEFNKKKSKVVLKYILIGGIPFSLVIGILSPSIISYINYPFNIFVISILIFTMFFILLLIIGIGMIRNDVVE